MESKLANKTVTALSNKNIQSESELAKMLKTFLVFMSTFVVFLHKYSGDAEAKFYLVQTRSQNKSLQDTFEADLSSIQGGDVELKETKKMLSQSGLYYILD